MTTMNIRQLDEKEFAVFEAIAEQSKEYPDIPFEYNLSRGQYFFNNKNVVIDRSEHREIIRRLSDEEIIDADWLIPIDENDKSSQIICDFARHKSWSGRFIMHTLVMDAREYEDWFCISIHPSQVEAIYDSQQVACTANISLANDPLALKIDCVAEDKSETLIVRAFNDDSRPYKIISYILNLPEERRHEKISRNELSAGIRGNDDTQLIEENANIRKIFDRNETIKTVLAPLIELMADGIRIKKDVELTKQQYGAIIEKAGNN